MCKSKREISESLADLFAPGPVPTLDHIHQIVLHTSRSIDTYRFHNLMTALSIIKPKAISVVNPAGCILSFFPL